MKVKLKSSKYLQELFLIGSSLVASLSLNLSPSLAATLAFSEAGAFTNNFNHQPQNTFSFANTSTLAISGGGSVIASAFSTAIFTANPASSVNHSLTATSGIGGNYLGFSQSFSEVGGFNFLINDQETFTFDFGAFLNLQTYIDNVPEKAIASSNISFLLFDSTDQNQWNILDYFQLSGGLASSPNTDYLAIENSQAFSYSDPALSMLLADSHKLASIQVGGSYSRSFSGARYLSLVEFKNTQAKVAVPVPASLFGGVCFGLFYIYKVIKRKKFFAKY
jgi:hypothetical protein